MSGARSPGRWECVVGNKVLRGRRAARWSSRCGAVDAFTWTCAGRAGAWSGGMDAKRDRNRREDMVGMGTSQGVRQWSLL